MYINKHMRWHGRYVHMCFRVRFLDDAYICWIFFFLEHLISYTYLMSRLH